MRVYTLLQDDFYDAVWEFNHDNPDPLYIIHGVWIDEMCIRDSDYCDGTDYGNSGSRMCECSGIGYVT